LLVGGSTRMPMVRQYVEQMSGKPPMTGVNVDEAVALGAAMQAHIDAGETEPRGIFSGFKLKGTRKTRDAMSHSLGVVAVNNDRSRYINSIIIPKNNPVPCTETRPYQLRTGKNHENKVEVYMLQGESDLPLDCNILGKYVFSQISHVPDNPLAVLDIGYTYDRNGVVSVAALQRSTKKRLPLTIEPVPDDMSWLAAPPPPESEAMFNPMAIFLVLDVSFSMEGDPLLEAKQAAKEFVKACDLAHMSIGVTAFGSSAHMLLKPSQNAKEINHAIHQLGVNGSTNMTAGIAASHMELSEIDSLRFIVLLTDGMPDNKSRARAAAMEAREDGVEIICIGTGGADTAYLRHIASTDADCIFAQ
ncbi:MAG: Hsp70 family protein, partial [Propionibacteriaceae bacterium]|nr:Hsp70 family protein [Propionibacteriaceae bacterium]